MLTEEYKKKLIANMSENLQVLRMKLGLTQKELAEMLGISRHTIMNFETGKSDMTWNNFLALVFLFSKNEGTDKLLNVLEIYTDEFNNYIKRRETIMENQKDLDSFIPGNKIRDDGIPVVECKDGKYRGKNRYEASNGDVYEGDIENGNYHGNGKYSYASGGYYEGAWENNNHHGFGVLRRPNGEIYEGNWENGLRNGWGKQTYEDGRVFEGEWNDGIPSIRKESSSPENKGEKASPFAAENKKRFTREQLEALESMSEIGEETAKEMKAEVTAALKRGEAEAFKKHDISIYDERGLVKQYYDTDSATGKKMHVIEYYAHGDYIIHKIFDSDK